MKKLIITVALAIVSSFAFSQIKVGALVGYGLETEKVAFGLNGEIFVGEKFAIAPGFNFMGKDEFDFLGSTITSTYFEINGDVHYYFVNSDAAGVYGLAGLNASFIKVKVDSDSESDNKIGANFGAGASFLNSGSVNPYVEVKYETPFEQIVIGGGVRFTIKGK